MTAMDTTARRGRAGCPRVRGAAVLAGLALAAATVGCSGSGSGSGSGDAADQADRAAEQQPPVPTTSPTTEQVREMSDAELAAATYVAGYPLVVTTRTLQRLGGLVGVNSLFWQSTLSGPESRIIVAPNRDTLYSIAVLDLRAGPMVLTLPEVADRYYTYQLLDAWTESFAYIGTRATDGRAGTWVIAPPGWEGEAPAGAEVIEATTPQVFLLGRYLVDDEADIADVLAVRDEASLRPLAGAPGALPPLGAPAGPAQAVPADATFFDELGAALAVDPPTTEWQRELFAAAGDRLGVVAGAPAAAGDAAARDVLAAGAAAGAQRITDLRDRRSADAGTWAANLGVGRYGDDIELRALVARVGWGANVSEEAVYPVARTDADGAPLDGSHTYRLTFPPGGLPPVDAFWSLSVYGADMFFVPHPSGRYTIGDRTPGLVTGDDGSLEITLSAADPGPGTNWLPVPDGPFVLMLRLYLPGPAVVDGTYEYPDVVRVDGPS